MMYDKRLIGTWQSDARKTRREIRCRTDISEKSRKILLPMFGKLRLRYTRTRVYVDFEGLKFAERYWVIAKDSVSVVIQGDMPSIMTGSILQHIHFEGKYYSICLGKFREYFRRIE